VSRLLDYLAMGGYAGYVWPAMAVTVIVMAVLWIASLRSLRAREAALRELESARAKGGPNNTPHHDTPHEA